MPKIFLAKVMHKRLFPKVNQFTYGVYYLALPLSKLAHSIIVNILPVNKFGLLSFHTKDHGAKDKSSLNDWMVDILKKYQLDHYVHEIILVAMPRVVGYVFNPVSFWICLDQKKNIRAVLYEVNNTFGETHSYLCAHEDGAIIHSYDWLEAEKIFHVSPFLERKGYYKFRFDLNQNSMGIWINFYNHEDKKQLVTALTGELIDFNKQNLIKCFWTHPLLTLRVVLLIHWQALKLILKGIRYIPKPKQIKRKLSTSKKIKKL